ncbi:Rieske (2Fe-2S) protein [Ekhidna sp.]
MRFKLFDSSAKAKEILEHNQPRMVQAGDKEVCIVRQGELIHAFQNACSHMGEKLHQGKVNYLAEIVCPLHTYRFNLMTGEESQQRCKALKIYSIKYMDDGVYLEC